MKDAFWENFNNKAFVDAQQVFDQLDAEAKQQLFAELFQQAQCQRQPHSVSVLFRKLHDDKQFGDFYQAWLPPAEKCNKQEVDGQTYQQFFPMPIRVINAIDINDPKQVVSVGLHWMSDEDLEAALSDKQMQSDGAQRGDSIAEAAEKQQAGIYKVVADDNLGVAF